MRDTYTQQQKFPETHDKIILNTDLRHKLSDKTNHFTRNSNLLLYNSDLYIDIYKPVDFYNFQVKLKTRMVIEEYIFFYYHTSFELYLKIVELNWLIIFLTIIDEIFRK